MPEQQHSKKDGQPVTDPRVEIFVFNHARPRSRHIAFDAFQEQMLGPHMGRCVNMVSEHATVVDPFPELPGEGSDYRDKWNPEPNARQQTADLVSMLQHVGVIARQRGRELPEYVMLWEDDCLACEGLWHELATRIALLRVLHPTMASMQVGMGGSGLVLASGYIRHLAAYLLRRSAESAVDVLINAYLQSYSRPHFLSLQTLSHHVGSVSTFIDRGHLEYGQCGSKLAFNLHPNVFENCWDGELSKLLQCDAKHNYFYLPRLGS